MTFRAAFLISGIVRNFDGNFPAFEKHFLNVFKDSGCSLDIFASVWNVGAINGGSKKVPDLEEFKKLYKPVAFESENMLGEGFPPSHWPKKAVFPHNSYCMFYKMKRALKMMKNFEKENCFLYDYVIKYRTDVKFESDFSLAELHSMKDKYDSIMWPDRGNWEVNDHIAWGDRDPMVEYNDVFSNLEEYCGVKKIGFHPESILKVHLDTENISIDRSGLKYIIDKG